MSKVATRTAYEQMCHFENYPRFMSGMQRVIKLSEDVTHWVTDDEDPLSGKAPSGTGTRAKASGSQ